MRALSILIVEDEMLIAETIAAYLRERGHRVCGIAISYEEAVAVYTQELPDLALIDIKLYGERSGLDFGQYLQAQTTVTPFIYLTSQFDKKTVDEALLTKPSGYLAKPLNKHSIWTTVESAAIIAKQKEKLVTIFNGKKNYKIPVNEITHLKADHVYVDVFTCNGETINTRNTLQKLFKLVDSDKFVQCHRSYIVNTDFIKNWTLDTITLTDDTVIPLSRSKRNIVIEKLSLANPS